MNRELTLKKLGRLLPALLFLVTGCASISDDVRRLPASAQSIELESIPFFPQEQYQCGPAALTTALVASDADVTVDEMVDKVYLPGRQGSLQLEMLAATRTSGRLPYLLDNNLAAVIDELQFGRPVVVLQNLGVSWYPRWHYAVVVGVDVDNDRVILRSGTEQRRQTRLMTFLRTWQRGNYWAVVVLRPDEMPVNVDRVRYLGTVASLEAAGQVEAAEIAWRTALQKWPDDRVAGFGLANVLAESGSHADAIPLFESLIDTDIPPAVVHNNLALSLLELGEFDKATAHIERALTENQSPLLDPELEDTRDTIENRRQLANRD
jgi:tetratricopeptide (TPR) repeat protein